MLWSQITRVSYMFFPCSKSPKWQKAVKQFFPGGGGRLTSQAMIPAPKSLSSTHKTFRVPDFLHPQYPAVEIPTKNWWLSGVYDCSDFSQWLSRWWQLRYVFMFTPKIGEDEPILIDIFQKRGWNHQLLHWKINGWNLQITHLERKMIFQTLMIMCKMLIFQGVVVCLFHFHGHLSTENPGGTPPTSPSDLQQLPSFILQGKQWIYTVDGQNPAPPIMIPIIYRVLTIPGGAGFCPSTVSLKQTYKVVNTCNFIYLNKHIKNDGRVGFDDFWREDG